MYKKLMKKILNSLNVNLSKRLRVSKLRRILKSAPQISSDGFKYWGLQKYDDYESNIFLNLTRLMKSANIFVNVGANHGVYCLKLSSMAERVYAFEPLQDNLNLLMKNVSENGLSAKVVIFPFAVGITESLVTIYGAATGGSLLKGWNQQFDEGVKVPVHSLDALLYDRLLKKRPLFLIDAEGMEYEIVRGAIRIVTDVLDATFCIEIPCKENMPGEEFNPNFTKIFDFFFDFGYRAWEIGSSGELTILTRDVVEDYARKLKFDGVMAIFSRSFII